jgi:rhodanese-related sulfurtransferase
MRAGWLCWMALVVPGTAAAADPPFPIAVRSGTSGESDHYCGLYCVHQAGRLTGRDIDLDRLIRPERLRGVFGSTADDLVSCCREFGIRCFYVPVAAYADVVLLGGPVITLIKSSPESPEANHWVLLLEADAGSAEVYDPSVGVVRVSAAELQSLWGSSVIVVLDDSDGPEVELAWTAAKIVLFGGVAGLALLAVWLLGRTGWHPAVVLIAASVGLATVAHLVDPAGFARNPDVIEQLHAARHPRTPAQVSPAEVLVPGRPVVFIDARTPAQFAAARIPGAVNIPITGSHRRNRQLLAAVPRDTHVVVYCNSESCAWGEALAKSTLFNDFAAVSVLEGGMKAYAAVGGKLAYGRPPSDGTDR